MRQKRMIVAMIAVMTATAGFAGDSAPFLLDTRDEPTVESTIAVTWDASWIGGDAGATVVIVDNGAEVKRATGVGELDHVLSGAGRHELAYTTYVNGVLQDEVYSAVVIKTTKCTIHFDANGGTGGKSVTQDYGSELVAPTVMRLGYTFAGWSPEVPATAPADDATYIAQWVANKYTLTFDANGGTGGTTVTQDYGTELVAPTVTRAGYTFLGWFTKRDGGERVTEATRVPAADMELFAYWSPITYYVQFHANGGQGTMSDQSFTYDEGGMLETHTFTHTGFAFAGWATNATGEVVFADGQQVTNLTEVADGILAFFAVWRANQYTVTFDANGGTGGWSRSMEYGAAITAPTVTRSGYTFLGWFTSEIGGLQVSASTVVTENVVYYAHWSPSCGHSATNVVNACAATCTGTGYTGDKVCAECGEIMETGSTIPALGHVEGEGVVTKEPTTAEEGVMTYYCTRCGVMVRTEAIAKIVVVPASPTFTGEVYTFWYDGADDCGLGKVEESRKNSPTWRSEYVEVNGVKEPALHGTESYAFPVTIAAGETFEAEVVHGTSTDAHIKSVYVMTDAQMLNKFKDSEEWLEGENESMDQLWSGGAVATRAWVVVEQNNVTTGTRYPIDLLTQPVVNLQRGNNAYYNNRFYNPADGDGGLSSTWTVSSYANALGVSLSGVRYVTASVNYTVRIKGGAVFPGRVWNICDPYNTPEFDDGDLLEDIEDAGGLEEAVDAPGLFLVLPAAPVAPCGHLMANVVNAQEATCSEAGYTGDKVCAECGEVLEVGSSIPALGHVEGEGVINARAATCTESGYTGDKVCTVCGEVIETGTAIPALGHVAGEGVINAHAATCTEAGYTGDKVCTVCGEVVETGSAIPALGHVEGEGVVTKEPTTAEEGVMTYYCTRCGAMVRTEAIAKIVVVPGSPEFTGEVYTFWYDGADDCGMDRIEASWKDSPTWRSYYVEVNGVKEPAMHGTESYAFPVAIAAGETFEAEVVHGTSTDAHIKSVYVMTDAQILNKFKDSEEWLEGENESMDQLWSGGAVATRAWVVVEQNNVTTGTRYPIDLSKQPVVNLQRGNNTYYNNRFYNPADGNGGLSSTWTVESYANALGVSLSGVRYVTASVNYTVRIKGGAVFPGRVWNICDPYNTPEFDDGDLLEDIEDAGGLEEAVDAPGLFLVLPEAPAAPSGVDVGEKGTVEASGNGYAVVAKEGETLTEADFTFGIAAKEAYVVSIAADGKSATVTLKAPEVVAREAGQGSQPSQVEEGVGDDTEDPAGMLASVEDIVAKHGESAIKAKPTPKSGEEVGALPVKAYEGLYYQAAWGDDLGAMTQGEKVQATGDTLYLGVIKQKGSKGFYRITVSEQ